MSLILVTKSTSAPANPYDGQVWVDTTSVPVLKVYDAGNTAWKSVAADAQLDDITGVLADLDTTTKTDLVAAINEAFALAGGSFDVTGTVMGTLQIEQHGVNVPIGNNAAVACSVGQSAPGDHFIVLSGSNYAHTITTINGCPFKGMGAGYTTGKRVATFSGAATDKLECVYDTLNEHWQVISVSGVTFSVDPT